VTGNNSQCVQATSIATGQPLWTWSAATHPPVMGVIAGHGIALVATGLPHGTGSAADFVLTNRLTALDAATGRQLWTMALAGHGDGQGDGQSVPAAITNGPATGTGATVIVAQANGTVQAVDAQTGAPRWTDPVPSACRPSGQGNTVPVATILTASPTVLYQCANANEVTAFTPATGAPRWTWQAPKRWSINIPPEVTTTANVTALVATGPGAAASNRLTTTIGPPAYDPAQVVAIDDNTGRPLWELDDVADSGGLYASNGQICPVSPYGAECLNARTGAESWQWRPAVTPSQESASPASTAVATNGRLYLVAPTQAAAKIDSASTTQRSAPGTFVLQVMDIATGHVIATRPLPSFYAGPNGVVVSADSPPYVAEVDGPLVLVVPELGNPQVVEAFDMMIG
jgi:outer membrane protein assembly factor BamB